MITIRPSGSRGHFDFGWLDTHHTFSFGEYYDPQHMGFRSLRVINEDVVQAGQGFGMHGHRDMEILTWVLSGALEHRDSTGGHGIIHPGEIQHMSAGAGIRHSEFNASKTQPVHLLQIWIEPAELGLKPGYEQKQFSPMELKNQLKLLASPDGREGSLKIYQDAAMYSLQLEAGRSAPHKIAAGRHAYVQVATEGLTVNGQTLNAGDGVEISDEKGITFVAGGQSPVVAVVFELA
jgi:quercetin 2,3-dioxygenase